jgi:hypothetical protein
MNPLTVAVVARIVSKWTKDDWIDFLLEFVVCPLILSLTVVICYLPLDFKTSDLGGDDLLLRCAVGVLVLVPVHRWMSSVKDHKFDLKYMFSSYLKVFLLTQVLCGLVEFGLKEHIFWVWTEYVAD